MTYLLLVVGHWRDIRPLKIDKTYNSKKLTNFYKIQRLELQEPTRSPEDWIPNIIGGILQLGTTQHAQFISQIQNIEDQDLVTLESSFAEQIKNIRDNNSTHSFPGDARHVSICIS